MKGKLRKTALCLIALFSLTLMFGVGAAAAQPDTARYTDPATGYRVIILDEDDLLTDEEENALTEQMKPVAEYGDIIFWSTRENTYDEITQAKEKRYALCGNESSGIFAINMSVRMVTFQSDGRINEFVNASYARTITDNVSAYASRGDYYTCAAEGIAQVNRVLHGNAIAQPMKYISYTLIGLMIAFVLVVGIVFLTGLNPLARRNRETAKVVGEGNLFADRPQVRETDSRLRAWVTVLLFILRAALSSSSGGSSGGRSSGGGGGGRSSGGGGSGGSSRF